MGTGREWAVNGDELLTETSSGRADELRAEDERLGSAREESLRAAMVRCGLLRQQK